MIDTTLIANYLDLLTDIDQTEDELQKKKDRKKDMAARIHSMLSSEGAGSVNVYGVTVSPARKMRAAAHSMPALIEALKLSGAAALVKETVNANTLSSWVNEFDPERMCSTDELRARLPEEVRDAVNLYEDLYLSVRRS